MRGNGGNLFRRHARGRGGAYSYAVYSQAGASPAITDTLKGNGYIHWDGTKEVGFATAITESYAADGDAPTLQAILFIQQYLQERAISGTTMTVKKLDGSTAAMTFTLSDATSPTSITRAS